MSVSGTDRGLRLVRTLFAILLSGVAATGQMQTLAVTETFSAAKLSAKEVKEIIAGVEESAFDTPDSWEKELRVRRVDLGGGPGIVVRGTNLLCGATGNCETWVLRSVGKWVSLFDTDQAPVAESFQLGPGVTNGIKGLTISANMSVDSAKRTTYRFDAKVYRAR